MKLLYSFCFVTGIWLMVAGLGTYISQFPNMTLNTGLWVAFLYVANIAIVYIVESFK